MQGYIDYFGDGLWGLWIIDTYGCPFDPEELADTMPVETNANIAELMKFSIEYACQHSTDMPVIFSEAVREVNMLASRPG